MVNVIVFSLGRARMAIDLRHVREVFTLGPVTPVPTAPGAIAGVVNLRGAVIPTLSLRHLLPDVQDPGDPTEPPPPVKAGDPVIMVEVDGIRVALAVERVDEVTTLWETPAPEGSELYAPFVDSRARRTLLVDVAAVLAATRREVERAGAVGPY